MTSTVRIRPLDLERDLASAVSWYGDAEVMHFSEGDAAARYDEQVIRRMYADLRTDGEVFIIEVEHAGEWIPVGDAALRSDTLPIVIGDPRFRSCGVGSEVLQLLVARARAKGWRMLTVRKVFAYNERSLRMYRAAGFEETARSTDDADRPIVQLRLVFDQESTARGER